MKNNMIYFKSPEILKMHSGHISIELTESGTWESFPKFAEEYANQIGAILIEELVAPDIRIWDIEINGIQLKLAYDNFPNCISLESDSDEGDALLLELFKKIAYESIYDGI